jgi:hypothetical protein
MILAARPCETHEAQISAFGTARTAMPQNLVVANWPRRTDDRGMAVEFLTDQQAAAIGRFEAAGPDLVRSVDDIAQFPLARHRRAPLGARQDQPGG